MKTISLLLLLFVLPLHLYSQNITNTLGTGGVFSIKDATATFFSLRQTDGNIGIGAVATPGIKLQVLGGPICGQGLLLQMGDFPGDASNAEFLTYKYSSTNWGGFGGDWDGGIWFRGSGFYFWGQGASLYPTLMMSSTGNVGIGTSTPLAKLDLAGGDALINGLLVGRGSGNQSSNTVSGYNALYSNTIGTGNTALGSHSLNSNSGGNQNSALGHNSLYLNTTGSYNTAVGWSSLKNNTIGQDNTAIGLQALYSNLNGYSNTAFGVNSLFSNTYGFNNTAVGYNALFSNWGGEWNTSVGCKSLYSSNGSFYNTAVGCQALYSSISGTRNTAVGVLSLGKSTTGTHNTALGFEAGYDITTGSNLTCLGYDAQPSSANATNEITLGDANITSLRCNVTTITSLSDIRDKKNIKDLDLGINFLMKLKPRIYNWDKREWYKNNISDGRKMRKEPTAGFIAQELDEVQTSENAEWLNLVLKDNPEKWEATPGNLLPIIVKAMQDFKREKDDEIAKLKDEVATLKSMNEKLTAIEKTINELTTKKQTTFLSTNNKED